MNDITKKLYKAKIASKKIASLTTHQKNLLLLDFEKILQQKKKQILLANLKDLKNFKGQESVKERLELNEQKFLSLLTSVKNIKNLPDPIGKVTEILHPKNKLVIKKTTVPLGLVGVIYESRPNVTLDLSIMALKTGNGIVLKGGKEAYFTNLAIVECIHRALLKNKLPSEAVCLISPKDTWQKALLKANNLVDVLIPRGSAGLIEWVRKNARVPIIETGAGVCHTFVDAEYNLKNAVKIIFNAKTQRPSVCNALDTLVVHSVIVKKLLPILAKKLLEKNVELRCDATSYKILLAYYPQQLLKKAKQKDFGFEFLSQIMAIKTVNNFEAGLEFVKNHTSGHSEAILTYNKNHAKKFLKEVDAAVVYHNASTRFTDGGEFGFGAEVGISTQKLHARGPMGLEALTSYKWVVEGKGQVRNYLKTRFRY